MAGEWIECTLADACSSIDYGITASASNNEVGPRFLRITDIVSGYIDWNAVPYVAIDKETTVKYRLHDGDIVIARTGASTGASAYIKNPPLAVFASYLVRLHAKPDFDNRFLYYYLKSDQFWTFIRGVLGDKSAQPNASASTMAKAPIRAPKNKQEQRAIAHILGTLDDKIELNRRMSETLEAMARAIFKAWFVDFEPVRAKMEGRWRRGESLPGLPAHLYDLFPSRLVDSELGEIPEGWAYLSFEEMVIANQGKYLPSDEIKDFPYDDFIYPVWGGNGIRGYSRQKMYDYPVVVLTCRGSNCGLIYKTDSESWVSNIAFACEPRIGSTNFIYVYFRLCSFVDCISGSAQPQITYSILRNKQMPYPVSPKICEAFSTIVDPIFQKISMNNHLSRTLAVLRDALLPKLISGELRVKDAERFLKERGL